MSNETDYLESLLFPEDDGRTDYSKSPDYLTALNYFDSGDIAKADEFIEKEHDANPENPYAWALKAEILKAQDAPESSIEDFNVNAINKFEEQDNLCEEYYDVMQRQLDKDYEIAQEAHILSTRSVFWARIIAKKRPTAKNLVMWGWFADVNLMHSKAIRAYEAALATAKTMDDPSNDEIYGKHLIPSHLHANSEQAGRVLSQAEAECPDGINTTFAKIYMLELNGHHAEAVDLCLKTAFREIRSDNEDEDDHALCEQEYRWRDIIRDIANVAYGTVVRKLEVFAEQPGASAEALLLAHDIAGTNNAMDFVRLDRKMTLAGLNGEGAALNGRVALRAAGAFNKVIDIVDESLRHYSSLPNAEDFGQMLAWLRSSKALTLADMGEVDQALAELNEIKEMEPASAETNYWLSYVMANFTTDYAKTLKQIDLTLSLLKSPDSFETHACLIYRMLTNYKMGDTEAAQADAKRVIEMEMANETFKFELYGPKPDRFYYPDIHPDGRSPAPYASVAHAILGEIEQAIVDATCLMSKPANRRDKRTNCGIATLTYALVDMTDEGIECLREDLKLGNRNFYFMETSPDLAPLRKSPEWAALMKEYKAKWAEEMRELK